MTAEIIILNKHAVALAADSKATVSTRNGQKSHDTVNKLFTLSKKFPVGIMIYGNAEFMGFPWEIVIKMYRDERGLVERNTVREYTDDFISFLKTYHPFNEKEIVFDILNRFRYFLFLLKEDLSRRECPDIVNICDNAFRESPECEACKELCLDDLEKRLDVFDPDLIANTANGILEKALDETTLLSVTGAFFRWLKSQEFSPFMTGVVIAGFGKTEKLPAFCDFKTDGIICGLLKYELTGNDVISPKKHQS